MKNWKRSVFGSITAIDNHLRFQKLLFVFHLFQVELKANTVMDLWSKETVKQIQTQLFSTDWSSLQSLAIDLISNRYLGLSVLSRKYLEVCRLAFFALKLVGCRTILFNSALQILPMVITPISSCVGMFAYMCNLRVCDCVCLLFVRFRMLTEP